MQSKKLLAMLVGVSMMIGQGVSAKEMPVPEEIPSETQSIFHVEETPSRIGLRDQLTNTITITETDTVGLEEGILEFEIHVPEQVKWTSEPTVEVVAGDVKINNLGFDEDGIFRIEVIEASTQPSTIQVSAIEHDISRTIAIDVFPLTITGSALPSETDSQAIQFDRYMVIVVGEICTLPTADEYRKTLLRVGDAAYSVYGSDYVMEGKPYYLDGHTMVPVRVVARSMGILSEAVQFQNGTVILPGEQEIRMTIGEKGFYFGEEKKALSIAPVINDGIVYVPLRDVIEQIGGTIQWDETKQQIIVKLSYNLSDDSCFEQ